MSTKTTDAKSTDSILLKKAAEKALCALRLYLHSAHKLTALDVAAQLTPDALEPYDALVSRFERAVEVFLNKFTASVDLFENGLTSNPLRDRLNLAEKLGILDNPELWIEMREVRNRIAHDYLPEQINGIYNLLLTTYRDEAEKIVPAVEAYLQKRKITST